MKSLSLTRLSGFNTSVNQICFIESVITFLVKDRSDKRSPSCSHAFVPGKVLELDIDRKRLNYNANLKFMPFGKSFHFYAIWEVYGIIHASCDCQFLLSQDWHLLRHVSWTTLKK